MPDARPDLLYGQMAQVGYSKGSLEVVMTECDVVISFYNAVPSHPGIELIRLPRCAKCFDETHDYSFGHAYCIPVDLAVHRQQPAYRPMSAEQMAKWAECERMEQEQREREAQ